VIDALSHFYSAEYATVHRAAYRSALLATEKYNQSREAVRKFLNAQEAEEIVFTRGTTDAINFIARVFPLSSGDEILISEMEHHSNIVPWQMAAERTGAKLCWIPQTSIGTLDWQKAITPQTRIVSIAHMSNVTGTVHPIGEIAKAAHAVGAKLFVDGAQAAACMPVDVQDLQCDFYAFSGHKCYGPSGIGVLYGRKELLDSLPPLDGGGDMIQTVELDRTTYQSAPLRFEAGTPIIGSAIALKAALDFIEKIGRKEIWTHGTSLRKQAEAALLEIPRVKIIGTAPQKGPILTFHIDGIHPLDLASFLDLKGIAIRSGHLCAQPLLRAYGLSSACRASFGVYNTQQDVDRFTSAVRQSVQFLN
jgi:cysteine desulfurase/selenocysteine lyase